MWEDLDERRRAGEPMPDLLKELPMSDLVAALAAAGERDAVAANTIATELLNRQARAPFLGAFIASTTFFVAIFVFDFLFTGSPFWSLAEARRRGYALAILTVLVALFTGLMYVSWRGWLRSPGRLMHRLRRGSF